MVSHGYSGCRRICDESQGNIQKEGAGVVVVTVVGGIGVVVVVVVGGAVVVVVVVGAGVGVVVVGVHKLPSKL